MNERLAELAQCHGIALAYRDIRGRLNEPSAQTLVALLDAMGVPAAEPAQVEAALAAQGHRRRSTVLPPVVVLHDDETTLTVGVNLPAASQTPTLRWRIDEEGGAQRRGECATHALMPSAPADTADGAADGAAASRELTLAAALPAGYHRLSIEGDGLPQASCLLVVAPRRCYLPRALQGEGRVWGATAQLYALRSERNWGIGDFTDLAALVELLGLHGAGIVGVNPLHALFPHDPEHKSPYSPSSRRFLNTAYLDIEAIDDFREDDATRSFVRSAAFQTRLQALRAAELVDYAGVAAAQQEVLERLFAHFRARHLAQGTERARRFAAWCAEAGDALRLHALFEALQAHFHRDDAKVWGWPVWPAAFREPGSPAVAQFACEHEDRVSFHEYLQWQADLQLGAVGRRSYALGLGVGLYADLAVSVDRAGAEAWMDQDLYCARASIGAPPDDLNPQGQDWGLPPWRPQRLREAAYAPFIAMLRANMRHAGALRIDHVMGLMRLYWIPTGATAAEGAYVHYPFDELLAIVALESRRNRCVVIGEDLGTVPDEVRDKLAAAGVLSYRLLVFERGPAGDFQSPSAYPRQALVAASTHDLPTLAGWWAGRDLGLRAELGLFPSAEAREQQVVERARDRARLLLALEREQLLPPDATVDPVSVPTMTPALARALHRYLARTPSAIAVAQLEDIVGVLDAVNLPGTVDEHPNWRRRLPLSLEDWPGDERFVGLAQTFASERGGSRAAAVRRDSVQPVIPRATYRVQLHRDFGFGAARELVPYLAQLGISHLYCSPFLRARAGSRHGYDIVDHDQFNPEIGNRDDFEALVETLKQHGMGLVIDVVPNHMGVLGADNGWWMDVLENGPASLHADYFDIDWNAADPALAGRVLLPILGDQYGLVLEAGQLKLAFEPRAGSFVLRYFEHRLPIDPVQYPRVLGRAERLLPPTALDAATRDAFASLMASFGHLPPRDDVDAARRTERHRDKEVHKSSLARMVREHPALGAAVEQAVAALNGTADERASFDALDALVDAQPYRLAYWRVAAEEINYRRFFDINELAALRMENPQVFDATHRLVLELAAAGSVDGLRIDHPDGLFDPAGYFRRLQERYAQSVGLPGATLTAEGEGPARPLYVVVEKIVAAHEQLPPDWAVHGTTGYRFANLVNGLFVDTAARSRLDRAWRAFAGAEAETFEQTAHHCRRLVMDTSLSGELAMLATALRRLARADRRTRDFTLDVLRQALAEVVAHFPVYRTYVVDVPSARDQRFIEWAVARARRRSRAADASVFDFLRDVLLGRVPAGAPEDLRLRYLSFLRRLQQYTAPVMAKGVEDTAFYRHQRLVALNEVGGDPDAFGLSVRAFHKASRDRAQRWPHGLLATSTHDTKRSEDVRARIDVISEMPAAWRLAVRRWSRLNRRHHVDVDDQPAPARNDEYLLYQTLAGTLPPALDEASLARYAARITDYMRKAVREAKCHSSWIAPNEAYESALARFVGALLGRLDGNAFLDDLRATCATLAWFGALNGLSMVAIKLTSPGVPDTYQGEEMIELTLVDPDNRRAVDYAARRQALERLQAMPGAADSSPRLRALLGAAVDGRAKMWTLWRALQLRRERTDLLTHGDYVPLAVTGDRAASVVAYARHLGDQWMVLVAGRLYASLGLAAGALPVGDAWGDTAVDLSCLPRTGRLEDVLSGVSFTVDPRQPLPLTALLAQFPVAILCGTPANGG